MVGRALNRDGQNGTNDEWQVRAHGEKIGASMGDSRSREDRKMSQEKTNVSGCSSVELRKAETHSEKSLDIFKVLPRLATRRLCAEIGNSIKKH